MKINQNLIARNHTPFKRSKSDIKWIVIHYVGALGDAYNNTEYYKNSDVGASADFFVGHDGDVWQANDYYNFYSWHCGGGYSGLYFGKCTNSNSIGIEMCVKKKSMATMNATDTDWYFTDATVNATIELTKQLMRELNIDVDHVIRHYDVNNKWCPAPYCQNNTSHTWAEFKQAIGQPIGEPKELLHAYQLNGLSEAEKIKRIAPLYQAEQRKSGMLASVGLAQFCLESGFGTTDLAQNADNLHGMKCSLSGNTWANSAWDGSSRYTKQTAEQTPSGQVYHVNADFRKYHNMAESIADRSAYFIGAKNGTKLRYPDINKITDAKKQIELIKAGGYATDINYVNKLISLVERFNLTQYDVVQQQELEIDKMDIFKVAETINSIVKSDIKSGKKWTYTNTKSIAETFAKAREKDIRRVNCARGVMWLLIEAKIFDNNIGQWYGKKDGTIVYKNKAIKEAMLSTFDIKKVKNKTLSACLKDGTVKPGDIVTYMGMNHTNLYLGNGRWFDTGHAYCKAAGENAEFVSWIGNTVYGAYTVGCVLRRKEKDMKTMYRVQTGAYNKEDGAKEHRAYVERVTPYDCTIEKTDMYRIYCGDDCATKEEAEKRAYELVSKYKIGAFVKPVIIA